MNGQAAIGDAGDPRPQVKPLCRWCGVDAEVTIEVEPARKFKDVLTGKIKRSPAITAPACRPCEKRLEEHKVEAKRAAEKAERKKLREAARR